MDISKNHINPAYHADLYAHYARLIDEAPTEEIKQFLINQQEHHSRRYTELMECHDMAKEFSMPVEDLIKLANLVRRRMQNEQHVTLDFDAHRIVVVDENNVVVAWFKTKTQPQSVTR